MWIFFPKSFGDYKLSFSLATILTKHWYVMGVILCCSIVLREKAWSDWNSAMALSFQSVVKYVHYSAMLAHCPGENWSASLSPRGICSIHKYGHPCLSSLVWFFPRESCLKIRDAIPWPWENIQNSKNRWNCETRTSFPISFVFPLWLRVASKSQLYGCNSPSLEWRQMEIESSCLHTYNSNFKPALSLYISFFP